MGRYGGVPLAYLIEEACERRLVGEAFTGAGNDLV